LSPSEHLSHAGPITNSVADYALALDVLAGPDPRDPNSLPRSGIDYLGELDQRAAPMRCAYAPTLFGKPVASGVDRCIRSAVDLMKRDLPIEIIETTPDWPDPVETFEKLWTARGTLYADIAESAKRKLDPGFSRMIDRSSEICVSDHFRTLQKRADFCRRVAEWFADFDLLLLPTVPIEPFRAEDDGPPDMDPAPAVPWARWTPFSYPFNLTGQPAASIPCGWLDSGLPVGLQVVAKRFDELSVLRFCSMWERLFDWRARRPAIFAGNA
jgi:aspartyl-tRNA(Asn)/glutamyl-tRNA(Gln) amidotransferase subunit A